MAEARDELRAAALIEFEPLDAVELTVAISRMRQALVHANALGVGGASAQGAALAARLARAESLLVIKRRDERRKTRVNGGAHAYTVPVAYKPRVDHVAGLRALPRRSDAVLDVCILMDCTGSMGAWMDACKRNLVAMIASLRKVLGLHTVRCAYVAYRDYDEPPEERISFAPFSDNPEVMVNYRSRSRAPSYPLTRSRSSPTELTHCRHRQPRFHLVGFSLAGGRRRSSTRC